MTYIKDRNFWFCTLGILLLGTLSGLASLNAREYYAVLTLPAFAPPGWLFGPVWTILFTLMGITLYVITMLSDAKQRKIFLSLFIAQFCLNLIWSPLFFQLQSNLLSAIDITILWSLLLTIQLLALKQKTLIMWLMGPYFLWVSFALALNYAVLFLN